MFRVLWQYAEKMKDRDFDQVQLVYLGKVKFLLKGADFGRFGQEYSYENPVYAIRTFPEKLLNQDGTHSFSTRTGGILEVIGKQMEDFTEFHDRWYASESGR